MEGAILKTYVYSDQKGKYFQKTSRILLPSRLENCDSPENGNDDHPQTISAVLAPCDIAIAAVQETIACEFSFGA